jgi:hypothetical protein
VHKRINPSGPIRISLIRGFIATEWFVWSSQALLGLNPGLMKQKRHSTSLHRNS